MANATLGDYWPSRNPKRVLGRIMDTPIPTDDPNPTGVSVAQRSYEDYGFTPQEVGTGGAYFEALNHLRSGGSWNDITAALGGKDDILNWEDTGYGSYWEQRGGGAYFDAMDPMQQGTVLRSLVTRPSSSDSARQRLLTAGALAAGGYFLAPVIGGALGGGGGVAATAGGGSLFSGAGAGLAGVPAAAATTTAIAAPAAAAGAGALSSLPAWVGPAIGAGTSLLGGYLASESAEDAVNAQVQASRESIDYLRETRDTALELARPFYDASVEAVNEIRGLQSGEIDFRTDPGYQFRLDEGMRALENSAFARGAGGSGGAIREALRYAQDYASNEYTNVYNRLAAIAGFSEITPAGVGITQNFGGNASNVALNLGEARGSGYMARGNAWQNAMDQIAQLDWTSIIKRGS